MAVSGWVLTDRHDLAPCAANSLHRATISVNNVIGGTGTFGIAHGRRRTCSVAATACLSLSAHPACCVSLSFLRPRRRALGLKIFEVASAPDVGEVAAGWCVYAQGSTLGRGAHGPPLALCALQVSRAQQNLRRISKRSPYACCSNPGGGLVGACCRRHAQQHSCTRRLQRTKRGASACVHRTTA